MTVKASDDGRKRVINLVFQSALIPPQIGIVTNLCIASLSPTISFISLCIFHSDAFCHLPIDHGWSLFKYPLGARVHFMLGSDLMTQQEIRDRNIPGRAY